MLILNKKDIATFKQLHAYIDEHYVPPRFREIDEDDFNDRIYDIRKTDWSNKADRPQNKFCTYILNHFNENFEQLRDCCRRACIPNEAYIKILDKSFLPSKECVCKFAIAANLSIANVLQLFNDANIILLEDNKFDVVMTFFFVNSIFDFCTINKILYLLDLPMLCHAFA